MRAIMLAAILGLCASVAHAQNAAPAQAAQSEIAACLLAQQGLTPVYRDTMEETCLRVAGDSCARTEWPIVCLEGLGSELRAAYVVWRPLLPETVPGTRLSERTYPNRLAQVDTAQSDTSCQGERTRLALAQCEVTQGFSVLIGLLSVARVADVTLN